MDVQESDNIEHRADLDLYLGAMGVRRELVRFDIGAELAVKADAFGVRVETEETDYLAGTTGDAGRVRLLLEGSGDWLLDDEQSIRPSVSIGARWDAGDAETGLGAELNAELGYDNVRLGLSLDLRGAGAAGPCGRGRMRSGASGWACRWTRDSWAWVGVSAWRRPGGAWPGRLRGCGRVSSPYRIMRAWDRNAWAPAGGLTARSCAYSTARWAGAG